MSSIENRGDQKDATKSGWTDNLCIRSV
jgi:hypothetical protein